MHFEIIGEINDIETIAAGRRVRRRALLRKRYGAGRWRKMKGVAMLRLIDGRLRRAEIHWYDAHGIGRKGFKIKQFLD